MSTQSVVPVENRIAVFQELRDRLGEHAVANDYETLDRYGRTTLPSAPRPIGVVYAVSKEDVVTCLEVANKYRASVYPISGGKNWGLGSACPTTEGQVVLDLSGMNKILEVNEELAYAVLEPGVTQGQLYEYIQANDLNVWMDATGAGPNATILGNLMERGYGHNPNGDRFHNSCAYEVVLADGTVLNTGYSHDERSKISNLFKTGIGPSLDGLFTQSNFGVVTRATIWLIPKPERFEAYAFKLYSDEQLAAAIDALRPLRSLGVINSTVHIANDYRVMSSHRRFPYDKYSGEDPLPESIRADFRAAQGIGLWNVLGGIYGTKDSVSGTRKALKRALKNIARPIFINDARLALFDQAYRWGSWLPGMAKLNAMVGSARSAVTLLKGEPVADHLAGGSWRSRKLVSSPMADPLERGDGIIWLTPLVPMNGESSRTFLSLTERVFRKHGFEPLLTFVVISGRVMCCPTTICYDRSSKVESLRAETCYKELMERCIENGFPPYRCGIQTMKTLAREQTPYSSAILNLKQTFDPCQILAPERYCPSKPNKSKFTG